MTYTIVHHQGAIGLFSFFWLHFLELSCCSSLLTAHGSNYIENSMAQYSSTHLTHTLECVCVNIYIS